MAANVTLTGKRIKDTYDGLLKLGDNGNVSTSFKAVTDGFGNATGLLLKSDAAKVENIYTLATIAELDANSDGKVIPSKEWVSAQTSAATSFIALTDTPSSFGLPHRRLVVNAAANAIEFAEEHFDFACSDETSNLAVGQVFSIEFPRVVYNINKFDFTLTTPPTGASIVIDVRINGTTLYGGNKKTIDVGETSTVTSSVYAALSVPSTLNVGDVITVHVTQIGSTNAGTGLKGFMTHNGQTNI